MMTVSSLVNTDTSLYCFLVLKVSFGATAYEFGEYKGIGRYSVVADKGRARDVTIQIIGGMKH